MSQVLEVWRMRHNVYLPYRGNDYSPVNYDWSLNLKYTTLLLYIILSILYILL